MTMTRAASVPTPASTARWRLGWWRMRQLVGIAYALPTIAFVAVLFVTPLLLVAKMSLSNWPLLGGDRGLNFPKNYASILSNKLFAPAVLFTIEYTVLVTILLIGIGLGLALLVQES